MVAAGLVASRRGVTTRGESCSAGFAESGIGSLAHMHLPLPSRLRSNLRSSTVAAAVRTLVFVMAGLRQRVGCDIPLTSIRHPPGRMIPAFAGLCTARAPIALRGACESGSTGRAGASWSLVSPTRTTEASFALFAAPSHRSSAGEGRGKNGRFHIPAWKRAREAKKELQKSDASAAASPIKPEDRASRTADSHDDENILAAKDFLAPISPASATSSDVQSALREAASDVQFEVESMTKHNVGANLATNASRPAVRHATLLQRPHPRPTHASATAFSTVSGGGATASIPSCGVASEQGQRDNQTLRRKVQGRGSNAKQGQGPGNLTSLTSFEILLDSCKGQQHAPELLEVMPALLSTFRSALSAKSVPPVHSGNASVWEDVSKLRKSGNVSQPLAAGVAGGAGTGKGGEGTNIALNKRATSLAVSALNKLRRCAPPPGSALFESYAELFTEMVAVVVELLPLLTEKHLSVAVNAVVGSLKSVAPPVKRIFFSSALARVHTLYVSPDSKWRSLDVDAIPPAAAAEGKPVAKTKKKYLQEIRSLSLTLNALSKGQVLDSATALAMGQVIEIMIAACLRNGERLEGQYVGLILNAYARAGVFDGELFRAFSAAIQEQLARDLAVGATAVRAGEGRGASFDGQSISNIVNAFARAKVRDVDLFTALANAVRITAPTMLTPQSIATILNGFVRVDLENRELFEYMSSAAQLQPRELFSPQSAALIVNAYIRADLTPSSRLLYHVAEAVQEVDAQLFSPQAVATLVNSYTRVLVPNDLGQVDAVVERLLRRMVVVIQARHAVLDVHSIAIIVHALARTSSWAKPASFVDDAVYHGLAQRLLDLTESSCVRTGSGGGGAENWQGGIVGQEVSMLFGGFVKAGHMTPPLQQRLLELTLRLPPSSLNAKDCVSLAHALSRCRLSAPPRLLQHICEASRRAGAAEEGGGWSFDLASMMIAALARLGYWNTPMFRLLVNVLDAEGGGCGGNHMDTLSLLSAAAAFRGGGQRGDGGEDLLEIFDRIEDMIRAMLLRCVESGMQQETQIAGPVTSGSEREGRPGLGLVLGFIAYAQKAGMLAAFMVGPGLEDDVDPEGGARLGESPGETMRAESAAEQDVRKCLVEALQVALETWLEGALREGGSRSNGLLGGVGVVGSVAIDGSIEVLPEFGQGGRALAFGMTGGRGHGEATSLAEVFNALECLGPCEGTRTMWQRVIQAVLRIPAHDLDARTVTTMLHALARVGQASGPSDAEMGGALRKHLLAAAKSGVFGRVTGASNAQAWPVEDVGFVSLMLNALSRNGLTDAVLWQRLSQHLQDACSSAGSALPVAPGDAVGGFTGNDAGGGLRLSLHQSAMVANAYARVDLRDDALLACIVACVLDLLRTPRLSQQGDGRADRAVDDVEDVQSLTLLASAFARQRVFETSQGEEALRAIARVLMEDSAAAAMSVEHAVVLANAFAKAQIRESGLWEVLSARIRGSHVSRLSFRAVANVLHAMAVLHVIDLPLLSLLEARLLALPMEAASSQGVATVAWSVAVLHPALALNANRRCLKQNHSDLRLAERIEQLLARHATQFDANSLSQVHQYMLSRAALTVGTRAEAPGAAAASDSIAVLALRGLEAFRQGTIQVSVSSGQQAEVGRALEALAMDVVCEFVDPLTGYSYDFWLPADKVALEFDGPFHFCRGSRLPLGSTILKHRHIQAQGHILVAIPYWEWGREISLEDKQALVARRIAQAKADRGLL